MAFSQKPGLKAHIRTHTGNYDYYLIIKVVKFISSLLLLKERSLSSAIGRDVSGSSD
jgi:hypothetical protein